MKRIIVQSFLFGFGLLLIAGCSSTTSTATKALTDASGQNFASTGAGLAQTINDSMGVWASDGSISGISGLGVKSASVGAKTITGPDSNGYYHFVQSSSVLGITYEADLYVKLVSAEGKVTDVYIYGNYGYSYSGTSSFTYTESFGSASNPYHGTATWSGSTLTSIAGSGSISLDITSTSSSGNHTIAMTFTLTSYSLPITSGADYPTGTISIATTYDSVSQPTMTVTFNGTATASFTYGDYSSTFTLTST